MEEQPSTPTHVSFGEAFRVWTKIGFLSFGGPAGQIGLMHKMLVDDRKWISNDRFLHALNYCNLLPGPEAQQLAIYIGWLLHGTKGGLAAGLLFVIPGMLTILALTILYAGFHQVATVQAFFYGLKPAVLAIVVMAVFRIASKSLKTPYLVAIASFSFIAMFFYQVPFPLVIWFLDESCGFEQILYRSGKQVDNADERVIVSVSPGPAFGSLEDAVECFNPGIAVA